MSSRRPDSRSSGFTLVELMIGVAIIGVLASVALPAYTQYVMQSKSTEVPTNLAEIYRGINSYWAQPFTLQKGTGATTASNCLVSDCCAVGGNFFAPVYPPTAEKRSFAWNTLPSARQIGFAPPGGTYGAYAWVFPDPTRQGRCGIKQSDLDPAARNVLISIIGITDLDGDGLMGGYTIQVGITEQEMYRQPGLGTIRDAFDFAGFACPYCAATEID